MRNPWLLSFLLLILPAANLFEHAKFKCFPSPSYRLPQYVLHKNGDAALRLVVSNRPSHQIVSHIAHILLTEALGYKNVSVASRPASASETIIGTHGDQLMEIANLLGGKEVPDYMVDLEVWLPPGLSLDNLGHHSGTVISAGPLGPVAQYGWFLLNTTTQAYWRYRNETIDHWRYFTNPSVASHFRPTWATKSSDLAKLLVYNEGSLTEGLMNTTRELIKQRNLLVEPVVRDFKLSWNQLLKRSKDSSKDLVESAEGLLIFTWFPNMITSSFPLQRVSFSSPCNLRFTSSGAVYPDLASGVPCDPYPLFQLTKWIWSGLKTDDSLAYSLFRNMSLTQIQYERLLRKIKSFPLPSSPSKRSELYRKIACEWLEDNEDVWNRWLPERPMKVKMLLGGLFPKPSGKWHDSSLMTGAREGIRLANEEVLKSYPYKIVMDPYMYNISCGERLDEALFEYNRIVLDTCGKVRGHLLGILAASCSDAIEPMVELSKHYHTVIVSPTVESTKYSQSDRYPYIFRTVPDMGMYTPYLAAAFGKMGWKRVMLIRKDDHFLNQKFGAPVIKIIVDFERQSPTFEEVTESLKKAKSAPDRARIFVVEHFEETTSIILCAAWRLNMTARAGFVWFLNPWLRDNFLSQESVVNRYKEHCTKKEVLETVERYFVLTHLTHAPSNSFGSQYYPYVIEAVLTFAYGLRAFAGNDTLLLSQLNTPKMSEKWKNTIKATNFDFQGVRVQFGKGNTRPNKEWILKVYKCNQYNCTAHRAASWKRESDHTSVEASEFEWIMKMKEIFINGKKPGDGSSEEDNCFWPALARYFSSCAIATAITVAIGVFAFLILIVIFILILRPQWNQLREAQRQLAPFSDILADLAPLEMKPFQIVLNLPLGEGAFGTVRGGEAKINGQWHAVAVKTLHERATQEEKMEFLSEARIMKAFNHPNIVKLLGVRAQSKSEPYMTVMEFLLYGDMKKYLIARHVLAKEEPEHTDICPAALTSMTIDIVEGLNYLHTLNFIHRDLALRNCLVSQNRQVKLCDFGLTRAVNDQRDYYRFERRGMLPVRWMAPESLHMGVFTFKSDIWSFGVVLYEIVTFGNKPYRDKRNEDVIECMRTGSDCLIRYLNNPEERLPKLLTLMRECFHAHAHERPDACTIISYLRSDPECVVPCLEEAPPDPGELPAGLLGPDSGDRRRGGNGGGGGGTNSVADRIRFHSGPRSSSSTTGCPAADVSLHAYDGVASSALAHNAGLNSSFPPASAMTGYRGVTSSVGSGANVVGNALPPAAVQAVTGADVRNYASSAEFIRMRSTRSLSAGLDDHSPDNASPTTGLLETEISMDSEVDGLAACDYDPSAPVFSAFANGTTPHSRGSMVMGSHASLHSRLAHA